MKTKLFSLFLALIAGIGVVCAEIIERVQDGELYYNLNTETKKAEVTYKHTSAGPNYKRHIETANIPQSIMYNAEKYDVTSIGLNAFRSCSDLQSVVIPEGVTSIGKYAFWFCSNLTSVTLPNGLQTIEEHAFADCSKLPSITFPQSLTTLGAMAFQSCTALTSIDIPNSVTSIGIICFANCVKIASFNVAASNTKYCDVNGVLFDKDNTYLIQYPAKKADKNYAVPATVAKIADDAFAYAQNLESITLPTTMTAIGADAFVYCTALTAISLPNGITTIAPALFARCEKLPSVSIPNSVKRVEQSAFVGCTNLTAINLPNSVEFIGNYAFSECENLESFNVPDSVKIVSDYMFNRCASLTAVTLPEKLTKIGTAAFNACQNLNEIAIPKNANDIGEQAFAGCPNLKKIYNYATTPQVINANVFDESFIYGVNAVDKTTCVLYVPKNSLGTYTSTDVWKDFLHIEAMLSTTIDEIIVPDDKEISTENYQLSTKIVREGQLFIRRNGILYNAQGVRVE